MARLTPPRLSRDRQCLIERDGPVRNSLRQIVALDEFMTRAWARCLSTDRSRRMLGWLSDAQRLASRATARRARLSSDASGES